MDFSNLPKLLIPGAIIFAIYKWAPNPAVKAAALGVAGTIVARQIPYVQDVM